MMCLADDYTPYHGEDWVIGCDGKRYPIIQRNNNDVDDIDDIDNRYQFKRKQVNKPKRKPTKMVKLDQFDVPIPIQVDDIPNVVQQYPHIDYLSWQDIAKLLGLNDKFFYNAGTKTQFILKRFTRLFMLRYGKGRLSALHAFYTLLQSRHTEFIQGLWDHHSYGNNFYDRMAVLSDFSAKSLGRIKCANPVDQSTDLSYFIGHGDFNVRKLSKRVRAIRRCVKEISQNT